MSYKDKLSPWCIIRPMSDAQMRIVGRFRRRVDAEGHLKILKQLIPNVPFEIMFDITPKDTDSEDLTPSPIGIKGRGEPDSNCPLSNKAAPVPSPRRGGLGRGQPRSKAIYDKSVSPPPACSEISHYYKCDRSTPENSQTPDSSR